MSETVYIGIGSAGDDINEPVEDIICVSRDPERVRDAVERFFPLTGRVEAWELDGEPFIRNYWP